MTQKRVLPIHRSTVSHHFIMTLVNSGTIVGQWSGGVVLVAPE